MDSFLIADTSISASGTTAPCSCIATKRPHRYDATSGTTMTAASSGTASSHDTITKPKSSLL